ncbi:MAG: peptidase [Polyangiaceae bacterium]|nr:peptidase [Polyangiaceae bacterium]
MTRDGFATEQVEEAPIAREDGPITQPKRLRAAGRARSDLIPRQVLFGNPERTSVGISPDGRFLSWVAPAGGVLNVWVAESDGLARARPITVSDERPITQYRWTYDGRHLLYWQDSGGDENFRLFKVDVITGQELELVSVRGSRIEVYATSERHPDAVMVGSNERDQRLFDVFRVNLRSGERALVFENTHGFVEYVFDADLNPRLGQRMTADGSAEWLRLDPLVVGEGEVFEHVPAADVLTTGFFGFDAAGTQLYGYSSHERDTAALVQVDMGTGRRTVLYEDARVDLSQIVVHPRLRTPQAVQVNHDRPRLVAIDAAIRADLEALADLDRAGGAPEIVARTLEDDVWIVRFDCDRASPKFYRWARVERRGELLFSAQPSLDQHVLARMGAVSLRARDGLTLLGYLSLPPDADPRETGRPETALPLVLLVHGGPWMRDTWGFRPLHQTLANRGYAVLSINYRGSTGFGKDFVNRGNREWGKKMQDDLLDAVAWAVAEGIAHPEKVCIMGGSYGGYAALAGLTLTPDVFACAIDIVGPSNIVSLMEALPPYWAPMIAQFHHRVGDPRTEAGKQALLEVSPLTHVSRIQRPLLIGQGANDPRVKKQESDQIVAAMQAKEIPVSYVVFPDEGHGFARSENTVAFIAVVEAFLSVHLGGWFEPLTRAELEASSLTVEAGQDELPGLPD